jgi:MFS family permease
MSDRDTEQRSGPAQFSLATLFVVVTGAAVACGLIASHVVLGTAAAVALVGGGWAWFALKSGRRRLAYYLATLPMGVAAAAVTFFLPVTAIEGPRFWKGVASPARADWRPALFFLLILAAMCLAVTLVARLLRHRIRADDERILLVPVAMVYWTAVVFAGMYGIVLASIVLILDASAPIDAGGLLCIAAGVTLVLAPLYATLTLPVTLPLAVWFRSILRRIDPLPDDWEQRRRLLTIGWLTLQPLPDEDPPQPPPPDEQAPDR